MLDRYDAFDSDSDSASVLYFTSQASRFVLDSNLLCPKLIRPKLCQFVVLNLDDVDRCDGVRVNSH